MPPPCNTTTFEPNGQVISENATVDRLAVITWEETDKHIIDALHMQVLQPSAMINNAL